MGFEPGGYFKENRFRPGGKKIRNQKDLGKKIDERFANRIIFAIETT